jgi:hypothetical protein
MTSDICTKLMNSASVNSLIMEADIAAQLRRLGWHVAHSPLYKDPETSKPREIDVLAMKVQTRRKGSQLMRLPCANVPRGARQLLRRRLQTIARRPPRRNAPKRQLASTARVQRSHWDLQGRRDHAMTSGSRAVEFRNESKQREKWHSGGRRVRSRSAPLSCF